MDSGSDSDPLEVVLPTAAAAPARRSAAVRQKLENARRCKASVVKAKAAAAAPCATESSVSGSASATTDVPWQFLVRYFQVTPGEQT